MHSAKAKSQISIGIIALIFIIIIGVYFTIVSTNLGFFWASGIVFGFILQKSRFCFTAAFRDPYLIGGASLTKALLIAFAITTIGFTAIKYGAFIEGRPIPGQNFIGPIGIATIVGSFIFGIGIVIAGGCASGTLVRSGEGFLMQILALIFFIIGSLIGEFHLSWWQEKTPIFSEGIFLPDLLGWFAAFTIQLILIAVLYIIADRWEENHEF